MKSIDFVKDFNGSFSLLLTLLSLSQSNADSLSLALIARTSNLTPGTPTPVLITIQPDRTFTFVTKSPPTSYLIKQAAGIELGSGETGRPNVAPAGTLSLKHVYEIAKIKQRDESLKGVDLESIARSVVGSCKSAGVAVVP